MGQGVQTPDIDARFKALSRILASLRGYWQESPFTELATAWQTQNPGLHDACLALPDDHLKQLESSPQALMGWLSTHIPDLNQLHALIGLPQAQHPPRVMDRFWQTGVGGRKAEQIRAFAGQISAKGNQWLDWCAGKSHLGRAMVQATGLPCVALERDLSLCQSGRQLAGDLPINWVACDVLAGGVRLQPDQHVLALHACGDLHRQLLRQAVQQPVSALALAPCCYALWVEFYEPLSTLGAQLDLQLKRDHLKLAVQEQVTAKPRQQRQIELLNSWRLGFDQLQRDVRGIDDYLPTPSLPLSALQWGFVQVCRYLAEQKVLALPPGIRWRAYESFGAKRWQQVRRLQLVRHGFRRALELWLVSDSALHLVEAGFNVRLSEFCQRSLTPRNILLEAYK